MLLPTHHPLLSGKTSDSKVVLALMGFPQERPPVWLMRQAGRSLPEYRKIREGISMLDSCLNPEIASEITLQPVRRHNVDAAIFFSDIVIPLRLAGVDVEIIPNVGPVLEKPIQSRSDFARLQALSSEALAPITDAVTMAVGALDRTPLLGFCGAPFTLASYLIEGKPSQSIPVSRLMMNNDPELWSDILTWCAQVSAQFLRAQILAGASAIQVFDSWAGRLSRDEYIKYAAPYTQILMGLISDLPVARIHFGVGTRGILKEMFETGATVMGIDKDTSLKEASQILGHGIPLQGNIDPELLLGDWPELKRAVDIAIAEGRSAISHILNLGHGVLPQTDPSVITRMVSYVHAEVP
ncbi:MAG TPA: uroporphyrinogen decarboxylase [Candidatus Paceibacterota bacterium]|nr:uroporphyrinogen decarboxylase [Candidatus Paceibacterota bacterium]